jgi:CBS domain-containing protein
MLAGGQTSLPVVDEEGRVVGIVTGLDILHAALPRFVEMLDDAAFLPPDLDGVDMADGRRLAQVPVAEAMSAEPLTVEEDTPVAEAALLMLRHGFMALPVLREGRLVGLVGRLDILGRMVGPGAGPREDA